MLLVAAAVLVVGAAVWRTSGDGVSWRAAVLALAVVAVPLSAVDLAEQRIPDLLLYPACALAALLLGADAATGHRGVALVRAAGCRGALCRRAGLAAGGPRLAWVWGRQSPYLPGCLYRLSGVGRVLGTLLLPFTAAALAAVALTVV